MSKKVIRSFFMLSVLLIFFLNAKNVLAAPRLVYLKISYYNAYDIDGDGNNDRFKYHPSNNTLELNGKKQKLFSDGKISRVYYYKYDAKNTFLIVMKDNGTYKGTEAIAYRYNGEKFVQSSTAIGAYNDVHYCRLNGQNLVFYTSPLSPSDTLSFRYVNEGTFVFAEQYYVNTRTHRIARKSNYGTLSGKKIYYYASKKTVKLSTSAKNWNTNGPKLAYGQKVQLHRVYFKYSGADAKKGTKIYEISVNGKKGWIKEASSVKFVGYNPKSTKPIEFADIVETSSYSNLFTAFIDRIGAEASEKSDRIEYSADKVKITKWTKMKFWEAPDTGLPYLLDYKLVNSGNSKISCYGIRIGMTIAQAKDALKSFKMKNITSKTTSSGTIRVICERFNNDPDMDQYWFDLTLKNGKISKYTFRDHIAYCDD